MQTETKNLAMLLGKMAGDGADGSLFPPPPEIFPWDYETLVKQHGLDFSPTENRILRMCWRAGYRRAVRRTT
jgi:hypothetical protein